MISYIRGRLAVIEEDRIIVDVGGVGYGIFMPGRAMMNLPRIGDEVTVHTYLNVKEDAMQLFGFLTRDDLAVFKQVITVSGIGPKGGLSILSQLSADDLRFAVLANDVKAISAAQGIGKKTAEKLILELKDKLSIEDALEHVQTEEMNPAAVSMGDVQQDAVAALIALGYGSTEALKAVRQVEITPELETEDVLKLALKNLMF
ncbi:MAG: Holliday junction branch migration protein RuvA [Eubacteriales bacterium]|nr:Holliday junction branch migration protein RuvA [Eubacteriales bacterium]